MNSIPMVASKDQVGSTKKVSSILGSAVYVDKTALKLLMDDCIKKKAELARCEMEKETYKQKAKDANEKLKTATEQLERLAKFFKDARSINTDETSTLENVSLFRDMSNRCIMSGDSKRQGSAFHTLAPAQKINNFTQDEKINMIESEILRLKNEIYRVNKNMLEARKAISITALPISDRKTGHVQSVELKSEIKELSNQLRLAKEDVEKRKKDIELVKSLLSQIRNNFVNFSNMVTLD